MTPDLASALLRLAGDPPALSSVPQTRRPLLELELVGREADLAWLETMARDSDDRLVTGQPGSGKTYLARQLARKGWGLFLVSDDKTQIVEALRKQKPRVVIVDDAHADPARLDTLRHLRQEHSFTFSILALSWEGNRDPVAAALGSPESGKVRALELLTRTEIRQLIRQVGVLGPEETLQELVELAANKPGLAVTLATLWLRGEKNAGAPQNVLRNSLAGDLEKLVGRKSTTLLGALALGGDQGLPLDTASSYLGLGRSKTWELTSNLAGTGVLAERPGEKETLSVWPRALRSDLISQVFFTASRRLDYRALLAHVPSYHSSVEAIVEARLRGADIPWRDVQDLVEHSASLLKAKELALTSSGDSSLRELLTFRDRSASRRLWQNVMALGEEAATWALEHYPGDFGDIARTALRQAPRAAIPRLLEQAVTTDPLLSRPSHPLRVLQDWLREIDLSPEDLIGRRRQVAELATQHLDRGGDRRAALRVLVTLFSPRLRVPAADPTRPGQFLHWGLLPLAVLPELQELWSNVQGFFADVGEDVWSLLDEILWEWIDPRYATAGADVPREVQHASHAFAAMLLRDLAAHAAQSPGLASELRLHARRLGLALPLPVDPVYALLFPEPSESLDDRDRQEKHNEAGLQALASRWAGDRTPGDVAADLRRYEAEAAKVGRRWLRNTVTLCIELAARARQPSQWLEAFLAADLPRDLIAPFLAKAVQDESPGWKLLLERCLESEPWATMARAVLLWLPRPPEDLTPPTFQDPHPPWQKRPAAAPRRPSLARPRSRS